MTQHPTKAFAALADEAFQQLSALTGNLYVIRAPGVNLTELLESAIESDVPLPQRQSETPEHLRRLLQPIPSIAVAVTGTVNNEEVLFLVGDAFLEMREHAERFHQFSRRPGALVRSALPNCKARDLAFFWFEHLFNRFPDDGDRVQAMTDGCRSMQTVWELTYDALREVKVQRGHRGGKLKGKSRRKSARRKPDVPGSLEKPFKYWPRFVTVMKKEGKRPTIEKFKPWLNDRCGFNLDVAVFRRAKDIFDRAMRHYWAQRTGRG